MSYPNIKIKPRLKESHDPKAAIDAYGKAAYNIKVNVKFTCKALDKPSWRWIEERIKAGLKESFNLEYAEVVVMRVEPGTTVSFGSGYDPDVGRAIGKRRTPFRRR